MAAIRPVPAAESHPDAGFTLTELLVVLGLIGLLTLAAPAMISAARPGAVALTTARSLAGDLRTARQAALMSGHPVDMVLHPDGRSYGTAGRSRTLMPGVAAELIDPERRTTGQGGAIRFFPDGSSSGGRIRVWSDRSTHWIGVHWLSGKVTLDE